MPYRTNPENSCIICSATTVASCRNCNTLHCDKHLLGASCAGCTSQLWAIERRLVQKVSLAWAAIAVVPAFVGLACLLTLSAVPLLIASMIAAGLTLTLTLTVFSRGLIRRRLASKTLRPSSSPLALPAPGEHSEAPAARPRSRAMHSKRRGPPRAVFMTRGGLFYQ